MFDWVLNMLLALMVGILKNRMKSVRKQGDAKK